MAVWREAVRFDFDPERRTAGYAEERPNGRYHPKRRDDDAGQRANHARRRGNIAYDDFMKTRQARRLAGNRLLWSLKASVLLTAALFLLPLARYGVHDGQKAEMMPDAASAPESVSGTDAENAPNPESASDINTADAPESVIDINININPANAPDMAADTENADDDGGAAFAGERDGEKILRVLNHRTGNTENMDMGVYLVRVLCGETPADFEPEALKAQAVAARTYTRYMLNTGGKHGGKADICTDPNCCQAYSTNATERENQKLREAVESTDGEIMLYDNQPVLAVFHSASAGLTRTAGDVWSGDQPYLRPVESPEDTENIPNYYSRAEFDIDHFRAKIRKALPEADLSGPADAWLSDAERDGAGSIITMRVGGVSIQGSKVRNIFNLRSACFTWELADGKIIFYVTGFGHGVGMSQYGANQMAKNGADYREILTHYYTGVTVGGYAA